MNCSRHPLDEEDICANFARDPDCQGYTEAEFREVLTSLLGRGVLRRVPYRAANGTIRYRIERQFNLHVGASGAFGYS